MTDRTWLTVAQAAERSGIKPGTLRRYVHEGRVTYSDPGNGIPAKGFWSDEFSAWLAKRPGRGARTDIASTSTP